MTNQPAENTDKSWDPTVRMILTAIIPALVVLFLFHSTSGALFVFIVLSFCKTRQDFITLFYCGLLAVSVRSCAYEPFNIPSGSMKSTLLVGDYLFVSKYSYGYSRYSFPFGLPLFEGRILEKDQPKRGDVVVFREPSNTKIDFIKRIIGLPGDHIQVKDGVLYINGEPTKRKLMGEFADVGNGGTIISVPRYEETLPEGKVINILKQHSYGPANNTQLFTVPEGHYFMMGDNRDNSHDSRFLEDVGYVPQENLVGRAEMIFFSTDGSASLNPLTWFSSLRLDRFFTRVE